MNKKIITKFFVLGLGIFMLSGCSVYPFGSPAREPAVAPTPIDNSVKEPAVTVPAETENPPVVVPPIVPPTNPTPVVASSSANEPAAAAALSAQVIREYQRGTDYNLTFTPNYFVADPVVTEISCDFAKACPCVYDANYTDEKNFCTRIAPSTRVVINKQNFCVQNWSEGAAGSTYTSYAYVTDLGSSYGHCVAIQFTKHFTSDCHIFGGAGAAKATADCEAEKTAAPGIVKNVVSSLKIIPVQAVQ